jgi:hypothetical protein
VGLYTQPHTSLHARVFAEAETAKPSLWSRIFSRKKKPEGQARAEKSKRAEQIVQGFEKEIEQERARPKPKPVTRSAKSTVKHHPPFRARNRDKFLRNIRQQAVKTNINLRKADPGENKWEPFKQTHSPGAISIAKEIERSMPKPDARKAAQSEVTRTMRAAHDALRKRKRDRAWEEHAKRRREEKAERRRQGLARRGRAAG